MDVVEDAAAVLVVVVNTVSPVAVVEGAKGAAVLVGPRVVVIGAALVLVIGAARGAAVLFAEWLELVLFGWASDGPKLSGAAVGVLVGTELGFSVLVGSAVVVPP